MSEKKDLNVDIDSLVVEMDAHQLGELIFKGSKATNNILFKGLKPFIFDNERDNREILDRLDQLEILVKSLATEDK